MKTLIRILLLLIILILFLGTLGAGGLYYLNLPGENIQHGPADFTIHSGENLSSIALRLKQAGIIRHPLMLRFISRVRESESAFKKGSYTISAGLTALQVHDLLVSGSLELVRVTIPEGWTMTKIAARFEENGISPAAEFLAAAGDPDLLSRFGIPGETAEGFLYPDTYLFSKDTSGIKVVEHMIENFFNRLEIIFPEYTGLTADQLYRKIIVASIVEREYRVDEEAPLMASVFFNRLNIRMHLGSCATIEYIITEEQGRPHPEFLTTRDLEIPSPYNTYENLGLPPGPISNPGYTALNAAFHPEESDYLYFVLQDVGTGAHYFSRNLDEHNRAKRIYLKKY